MTGILPPRSAPQGLRAWLVRLAGSRRFQTLAARLPVIRHIARAEGAAIFDLVSGFVQSQALRALVELDILHRLRPGPLAAEDLSAPCGVPAARLAVLLQAGAAMGLLSRRGQGRYALSMRGAALLAVPGLEAMIRHHAAFYADMADPVALLRGGGETELARFWPYVFGASGAQDPEVARTYSNLMAESQVLVAEDTLRMVDFRPVRRLMDVGGGSGAFLAAVGQAYPHLRLTLLDLPAVAPQAEARLTGAGLAGRFDLMPGSFRDGPLPAGADAISLVRVLYDHDDSTVASLLEQAHKALPPGGRLIISEPMSGGETPDRATDVYFAFYTMAMQTGRTRSADEIAALLAAAGFAEIRKIPGFRPFVTSVVTAKKLRP